LVIEAVEWEEGVDVTKGAEEVEEDSAYTKLDVARRNAVKIY
jgi:hypothetical protein